MPAQSGFLLQVLRRHFLCFLAADRIFHRFDDRLRDDTVFLVVGLLDGPAAVGLVNGPAHGVSDDIGVHMHFTMGISGSPADGLDQ